MSIQVLGRKCIRGKHNQLAILELVQEKVFELQIISENSHQYKSLVGIDFAIAYEFFKDQMDLKNICESLCVSLKQGWYRVIYCQNKIILKWCINQDHYQMFEHNLGMPFCIPLSQLE